MNNDARPDAPTPHPAEDLDRSAMRWLAGALRWEGTFRSFGEPIMANAPITQAHCGTLLRAARLEGMTTRLVASER